MTPLQQRVQAQLDLAVYDGLTVGAVMMAVQREKVLALEAAGYSDLAAKRLMRTDAIFDIRSISNRGSWKGQKLLSSSLVEEMTRPVWQTSVHKYHAGLGWAIHTGKEPGDELRRHRRKLWSKRGQRLHPLDGSEHTTHSYLPDALLLGRF